MAKAQVSPLRSATWTGAGLDPVTIWYRPIGSFELSKIRQGLRSTGPQDDPAATEARNDKFLALVVDRVVRWDDLESEPGVPAPCTEETRREFFGVNAEALKVLIDALFGEQEDPARPNESGGGSGTTSPSPGSLAGIATNTETSAETTGQGHAAAGTAADGPLA